MKKSLSILLMPFILLGCTTTYLHKEVWKNEIKVMDIKVYQKHRFTDKRYENYTITIDDNTSFVANKIESTINSESIKETGDLIEKTGTAAGNFTGAAARKFVTG